MKRRWVCNDVWMDIFPLFDRPELGLKMALFSDRFDVLVDTHFDGKSELTLWNDITIQKDLEDEQIGTKAKLFVQIKDKFVEFPMPYHSLPNKIRFRYLQIEYIDYSVITFLRANKPIWDRSGTNLELYIENVQPIWDVFVPEIWPIFATNIRQLGFNNADDLDNLRRHISPTILIDLDQLNSIDSNYLLPDVITDDGPNTTAGQALAKWLHTPTIYGQPKRLRRNDFLGSLNLEWVNNFKETFLRATTSVRYKIQLYFCVDTMPIPTEQFELMNKVTQEKLTLKLSEELDYNCLYNWLLQRCPIGETAMAPVKWKDCENSSANLNNIRFDLWGGNSCIGPL